MDYLSDTGNCRFDYTCRKRRWYSTFRKPSERDPAAKGRSYLSASLEPRFCCLRLALAALGLGPRTFTNLFHGVDKPGEWLSKPASPITASARPSRMVMVSDVAKLVRQNLAAAGSISGSGSRLLLTNSHRSFWEAASISTSLSTRAHRLAGFRSIPFIRSKLRRLAAALVSLRTSLGSSCSSVGILVCA